MKILSKYRILKDNNALNADTKTVKYINMLIDIGSSGRPMEPYLGMNIPILHEYSCGHRRRVSPHSLKVGSGCKLCAAYKNGRRRAKSNDNYLIELKNNGITDIVPLEEYISSDLPILHKCLKHNLEWKVRPSCILNGTKCKKCANEANSKKKLKSTAEYIHELSIKNPTVKVLGEYKGEKIPILHYYEKCGCTNYAPPASVLRGSQCNRHNITRDGSTRRKTQEQYENEVKSLLPNVVIIGEYKNDHASIECKCLLCGNIWFPSAGYLVSGRPYDGCPNCHKSKGEYEIEQFLLKQEISFICQKTFDDLRGIKGRCLSYDFYLPEFYTVIEFQGKQHEKPIAYFGGKENFEIQQEHDKRKRIYAHNHNLKLIEIWYYDYNRIEEILIKELKLGTAETAG